MYIMSDELIEQQMQNMGKFELMVVRELSANGSAIADLRKSHDQAVERISGEIQTLKINERELKIKSSMWGAITAAIVSIATVVSNHFISK